MPQLLSLLLAALIAVNTAAAQSDSRGCGLKIAPCPSDQNCIPDNDDCTDLNRCLGHCEWKNMYADCGGHRAVPKYCDEWSECKDDPREPYSCGMACDVPGICIPKHVEGCDGDEECSDGLWCYDMKTFDAYGTSYSEAVCM